MFMKTVSSVGVMAFVLITFFMLSACGTTPDTPPPPPPTPTPAPPQVPETTLPSPTDPCPDMLETRIVSVVSGLDDTEEAHFKVFITFNQAISILDDTPEHWPVTVTRTVPYLLWGNIPELHETEIELIPLDVSQQGTNTIVLEVSAREWPFGEDACAEVEMSGEIISLQQGTLRGDVYLEGTFGEYAEGQYFWAFLELPGGTDATLDIRSPEFEVEHSRVCGTFENVDIDGVFSGTIAGHGEYTGQPVSLTNYSGQICGSFRWGVFKGAGNDGSFTFEGTLETDSAECAPAEDALPEEAAQDTDPVCMEGWFKGKLYGEVTLTRMQGLTMAFDGLYQGVLTGTLLFEDELCPVEFSGLLCDADDYHDYFTALLADPDHPRWFVYGQKYVMDPERMYTDEVAWEYTGEEYAIGDVFGEYCPFCELQGEACCEVPCPTPLTPECPVE